MKFGVFTVVLMMIPDFWHLLPCRLVYEVPWRKTHEVPSTCWYLYKKCMVPYPIKYKTFAISISSVISIGPPLSTNHPNLKWSQGAFPVLHQCNKYIIFSNTNLLFNALSTLNSFVCHYNVVSLLNEWQTSQSQSL